MISSGATIIDIGCGSGRDARVFSERGYNVTGIDFSPSMIEIAKSNAPKAAFYVMDMLSMSLDNSFDSAWANASLLHIPKIHFHNVLSKIYHILNPDGIFYISLKMGVNEGPENDSRYGNLQKFFSYFKEDELKNFLIDSQFVILDLFTTSKQSDYHTHPYLHAFCKKGS